VGLIAEGSLSGWSFVVQKNVEYRHQAAWLIADSGKLLS
jgi:hypothetical protein